MFALLRTVCFLLVRRPPRSTRTDTLFPDTTLFRSGVFATDKPAFHFGGITRAALMPDGGRPLDDPGLVERAAKGGQPDLWVHPPAAATTRLDGRALAEIAPMKRAGAPAVATGRARVADAGAVPPRRSPAAPLRPPAHAHAEHRGAASGQSGVGRG